MTASAFLPHRPLHGMPAATYMLDDLTSLPRFGLKGTGSAAWLTLRGLTLPDVNRTTLSPDGLRILRLGREEFLILGEAAPEALTAVVEGWKVFDGARGYRSWREEGWAWMRLAALALSELMARLCAVDLRPGQVDPDAIVQSRFARLEAVIVPSESAVDLFFDVASKAYAESAVAIAALGLAPRGSARSEGGA